jgi:hypothetical protein
MAEQTTVWEIVRNAIDNQLSTSGAGNLASAVLNELSAAGYSIVRSKVISTSSPIPEPTEPA